MPIRIRKITPHIEMPNSLIICRVAMPLCSVRRDRRGAIAAALHQQAFEYFGQSCTADGPDFKIPGIRTSNLQCLGHSRTQDHLPEPGGSAAGMCRHGGIWPCPFALVGLGRQRGDGSGTVGRASFTGRALRRFEDQGHPGGGVRRADSLKRPDQIPRDFRQRYNI